MTAIAGESVRIEFTKWGGTPHWHFDLLSLGADEHGSWFGAHSGAVLQRGSEPPIVWIGDFAILVPREGNWVATFNAEGKYELYIDVTGPVTLDEGVIRADDLDLDVVRLRDGTVLLLDEDEFLEHQHRFGYPSEVVLAAERTATHLMDAVSDGAEPFGRAGELWLARLAALPSPTL